MRFSPQHLRYVMKRLFYTHRLSLVQDFEHLVEIGVTSPRREPNFDYDGLLQVDIFDLGANRGADSLYYLAEGYSVFAVDAKT